MSEPQQLGTAPIEATDLVAMRRALRALVDASPLSMATIEAMAGLPRNYLPKILGEPPTRGLSAIAIFSLLPIVGHKVTLQPDLDAQRKIKARHDYQICDERQRRKGASHWQRAKALRIIQEMAQSTGKIGAIIRMQKTTPEQRKRSARKAAKMRWRKPRVVEITPNTQKPAEKRGALQNSSK